MKRIGLDWFFFLFFLSTSTLLHAGPVPDTGQTICSAENGTVVSCAGTGQDGEILVNPPSYTKLDADGNELPVAATQWAMVRDNGTGLIWEVKTDDGAIRDKDRLFSWYDPDPATNGGNAGTAGNGSDTEDLLAALNAGAGLGGFTDWRLPTREELRSIADYGVPFPGPTVDAEVFPNTPMFSFWSSDSVAGDSSLAWSVSFYDGNVDPEAKSAERHVRAVRGGGPALGGWVVNDAETATDSQTGLMWRRTAETSVSWTDALSGAGMAAGGYGDWRLPTIKELASIVDLSRDAPALDLSVFSDTVSSNYWAATSYAGDRTLAWYVYFLDGDEYTAEKTELLDFRAVRGGQWESPDRLLALEPAQASHWFVGCPMPIQWETRGISGEVDLRLSRDGGKTFETLVASTPNDGFHEWAAAGPATVNGVLEIVPLDDPGKSTAVGLFSIHESPFDPPEPVSLTYGGANPTAASELVFSLQFSEPVEGLSAGNFSLETDGVSGAYVSAITGGGAVYEIQVSEASGNGTVQLDFVADCSVKNLDGYPVRSGLAGPSVTIDGTLPSAPSVAGPAVTADATPAWTWYSVDGGGPFRYKLDDPDLSAGAVLTSTASFAPSAPLSEGQHVLYVQERDAAGNWSASGESAVVVDRGVPCSSATSAETSAEDGTILVRYQARDRFLGEACDGSESGGGLSAVRLFVKGPGQGAFSPAIGLEDSAEALDRRFVYHPSAAGEYEFYTVAEDRAGNGEAAPSVADVSATFSPSSGVRFIPEPDSLVLFEESGEIVQLTLRLSAAPSAPVSIGVYMADKSRCAAAPARLTLDGGNWDTGVAVSLKAENNEIVDPEGPIYLEFGQAESDDPEFNGIAPPRIPILIEDDDSLLQVRSIQPTLKAANTELIAEVQGAGFSEATRVFLADGGADLAECEKVSISEAALEIRVPGQAVGDYDLRFVNPGKEVFWQNAVSFLDFDGLDEQAGQRAILVAGGGPYDENFYWENARTAVSMSYRSLRHQGFDDERIFLMSPRFVDTDGDGLTDETGPGFIDVDGDGDSEVDETAGAASLEYAVTEWAASGDAPLKELLIYYVGHGGRGGLELTKGEVFPIGDLDEWLDQLQAAVPIRVIAVFESCYAGAFLEPLIPPAGRERIVVASASADQDAAASGGGKESFSGYFWDGVRYTGELYQSYFRGVNGVGGPEATPRVDVDGDGLPDEFTLADVNAGNPSKVWIGMGKVSVSNPPVVGFVESVAALGCETTRTIRALDVDALNGVSTVYARIVGPLEGLLPTGEPRRLIPAARLDLLPGSGEGEWAGEFNGFDEDGEYEVKVYAADLAGVLSLPKTTRVVRDCGDAALLGDLDDSDSVDLADALIGLRVLAGRDDPSLRTDFAESGVDVGGDGRVGMADVVYILRKVAGN